MSWKETYENEINSGGQRFSFEWYLNHSITKELISKGVLKGRICDVACGLGVRSLVFSSVSKSTVIGVDSDDWAINFAKKKATSFGVLDISAQFEIGSFYELPFPRDSFDTVIFIAGIEHAAFPIQVIRELFRIASPTGQVVITVTLNDFHADPDHKSSFSEKGLLRLLSSFGETQTWVADHVIYAISKKYQSPRKVRQKRLIYADMRHPDTYTGHWDQAFQSRFDMIPVSFDYSGKLLDGEEERLLDEIRSADVLHFGTGAIHLSHHLLEEIRQHRPDLLISKWWGDVSPERFNAECAENSDIFDTIFLSVSNFVGRCNPSCTQIHLNSPGVRPSESTLLPFCSRPWDVGLFANAYSEQRLAKIIDYLPKGRWNSIWYGDGSPRGRINRDATNQLLGLCRINLNIVEPEHLGCRHWFSARISNALAAGNIVITSRIDGLHSVLSDMVFTGGDSASSWHKIIDMVVSDPDNYKDMSNKCIDYYHKFLSYERAVDTVYHTWGASY